MQGAKDVDLSNTSQTKRVDMNQGTVIDASNKYNIVVEISSPENLIITSQPNETNHGQNVLKVENKSCGLQIAKPKLPKFSGDVQDYAIFRADFKHVIERRYSMRDHPASHMS